MDGSKMPHLLPVSVNISVTVVKKVPDAAVRRVMAWALFKRRRLRRLLRHGLRNRLCTPPSPRLLQPVLLHSPVRQLTDAEAAQERTHWIVILCCAAFQAATAALVLWLPGRRRRWVLRAMAYLALVLTVVGHCMFFADVCLNHAGDPGRLACWILCIMAIVFYAVGDIISFLALFRGGED